MVSGAQKSLTHRHVINMCGGDGGVPFLGSVRLRWLPAIRAAADMSGVCSHSKHMPSPRAVTAGHMLSPRAVTAGYMSPPLPPGLLYVTH